MIPKLIFSDLDGTLLNNKHQITFLTKQAISQIVTSGSKFIPVSARMPAAIKPIMEDLEINSPLIAYNGALICDEKGKVLKSDTMATELAQAICQNVSTNLPELVWNIYSNDIWAATQHDNYWVAHEEEIVAVSAKRIATWSEFSEFPFVHKVLLMGASNQIEQAQVQLKKMYPTLSIVQSSPNLIEITNGNVEKKNAVKYLMDYYQARTSETIAFGDNFNDLGMLKTVGTGYIMENAPTVLKEKFANVTLDNNHDGVAVVLNQFE
ncbi:Cof-type HAD-IIB family hydrolase [Ligilactobacillus sp. WILCCON 0076]|uniref:Cof-type HAD-IIB family hydrolase n=1 Tax=Ligilactobacillus ubinensis TaxID=2876789 RepID=A0A9X2FKW5_9LACO|nr:Cof-type HAD-IIB family hydrolase [Ligilactobacillus ubinensis]MCP0887432.1 Cof-type HAD-IIB family hydrolase [Ligilactobacillus ubinensis]